MIQADTLLKFMLCLLLAALGLAVMSDPAFAQAMGGAGDFSCVGGTASGNLYDSGASCPTTISKNNIFSFLICNMEQLSSNLMGSMFCGMITSLQPIVMSVLVLSLTIFGAAFTIGVIPLRAGDFLLYLIKFAAVFAFATSSDFIIGIAYNFLVSGIRDGVAVALSGLYPELGPDVTGADLYAMMDGFLGKAMSFATDYVGAKRDGSEDVCKNALFAAMAVMAFAFPPIFYISVLIILKVALTFLRAVFGYVYALVGIAFLLTLAPFFLSFFLFKATRALYEKWIGYLVSFTLQMIILFAFLAFILSIDVKHISESLPSIVMYQEKTIESTQLRMPWEYCTLCDFKVVSKDNPGQELKKGDPDFISKGQLVCNEPKTAIGPLDAVSPPGGKAPDPERMNSLLTFATTGLLSLFVLAYLVENMLTYAASLSKTLASAGAQGPPQLGGGAVIGKRPTLDLPGEKYIEQFENSYDRGFSQGNNAASAATQGVKNAMSDMVLGRPAKDAAGNQTREGGLVNDFTSWLSNPNRTSND